MIGKKIYSIGLLVFHINLGYDFKYCEKHRTVRDIDIVKNTVIRTQRNIFRKF